MRVLERLRERMLIVQRGRKLRLQRFIDPGSQLGGKAFRFSCVSSQSEVSLVRSLRAHRQVGFQDR